MNMFNSLFLVVLLLFVKASAVCRYSDLQKQNVTTVRPADFYHQGSTINIKCLDGYQNTNQYTGLITATVTCDNDGTWDSSPDRPLSCEPINCASPQLENAVYSAELDPQRRWYENETISVTCEEGYGRIGGESLTLTCIKTESPDGRYRSGDWTGYGSDEPARCLPLEQQLDCGEPPEIENGHVLEYNSSAKFGLARYVLPFLIVLSLLLLNERWFLTVNDCNKTMTRFYD